MLDFLFKKAKLSVDMEKLLNIHIEAGVLNVYDVILGWCLCGKYEDMKKNRGLLGQYLISNQKQIKKLSSQLLLIPEVGASIGFIGAWDYITEVISENKYNKLRKNPPSAEDVDKICRDIYVLVIKEVKEFMKLNELL